MSLQLWLPLNGNLNNNGIANATITNSNATVDASGKIGSCYSFNGSTSCIEITCSSFPTFFSGPFSICMWFYNNDNSSRSILFGNWSLTGSFFNVEKFANNTVRFYWNGSPDITFGSATLPAGVWTHLTVTRSENTVKCYINGELKQTSTTALTNAPGSTATLFRIGRDNRSDDTATNGKFNDFRLYDHELSPKEVKEISKALILHLPLDNNGLGNPNLINTTVDTSGRTLTGWEANQNVTFSNTYQNNKYRIKCQSNQTTSTPGMKCFISGLSANTNYTASCYIQTSGTSVALYAWKNSTSAAIQGTSYAQHTTEEKLTLTFNTGSETSIWIFLFMSGVTTSSYILVRDVKLELGSTASQYAPNIASESTVYDTSGYCNNGTCSSTKPTVVTDSPRYNSSLQFNGSSTYIACGRGAMVRDALTVNVWAHMDDWSTYAGRIGSCTEGGGWNFEPGSSKMNFAMGTGESANTYKSITSTQTLASLSGWVMFTGTYDGFNTKIYINGVLSGTNTAYTTKTPIYYHSGNGIFIGAEAASSATTPGSNYFNGKISDFRIYATALSAEDIAELYKTSAAIDNGKSLYCYSLME